MSGRECGHHNSYAERGSDGVQQAIAGVTVLLQVEVEELVVRMELSVVRHTHLPQRIPKWSEVYYGLRRVSRPAPQSDSVRHFGMKVGCPILAFFWLGWVFAP